MTTFPAKVLCARMQLARELDVEPSELEYVGVQSLTDFDYLLMFTVNRPDDPLHHTTRSVKVSL